VYFATAHTGAGGGLMVTASHNPLDWNGLKLVREGSRPIAWETGLGDIHDLVVADSFGAPSGQGTWAGADVRPAYSAHVAGYLDPTGQRPLRILVNAGNGAAGPTFDAIAERLAAMGVRGTSCATTTSPTHLSRTASRTRSSPRTGRGRPRP
jgi:phosphomannomutase